MPMEGIRQWTCKYFHIASVQLPGGSFLRSQRYIQSNEVMNPGTIYGSVFSVERAEGYWSLLKFIKQETYLQRCINVDRCIEVQMDDSEDESQASGKEPVQRNQTVRYSFGERGGPSCMKGAS